jgi:hypothetical protein
VVAYQENLGLCASASRSVSWRWADVAVDETLQHRRHVLIFETEAAQDDPYFWYVSVLSN